MFKSKKIILFLFIILHSCTAVINESSYDYEAFFDAYINSSKKYAEINSTLSFKLKELSFKGDTSVFGNPVLEKYALDINCDNTVEKYATIPEFTYQFKEKGSFSVCINIVFSSEKNTSYKKNGVIKNNNFNDIIVIHDSIYSFDIFTTNNTLKAGAYSEKIIIKAYDANNNILKNVAFNLSLNDTNSNFFVKENNNYSEISSFKTNEEGFLELYIKARENLIIDGVYLNKINLTISSTANNNLSDVFEFNIIPNDFASYKVLSIGGNLKDQTTFSNEEDFGDVSFILLDQYANPIYNETIQITITDTLNNPLNRAWTLFDYDTNTSSDTITLTSSSFDSVNPGLIKFKVLINNDYNEDTALISLRSENNITYSYTNSIKDLVISKIEACCTSSCINDSSLCSFETIVADPNNVNPTNFKVKVFDNEDNPAANVPIYVKLTSGTKDFGNLYLNPLDYNASYVEEDINNYGPSLEIKDEEADTLVLFYSDNDNVNTKEKITPYFTDEEGVFELPYFVAGKLKSLENNIYGLRLSYLVDPDLNNASNYVDFSSIKANPRQASKLLIDNSIENTDVDLFSEGIQWYKDYNPNNNIEIKVVDKFNNLVETNSYNIFLTMVSNLSDLENQFNPVDGKFFINSIESSLLDPISINSNQGIANFTNVYYGTGAYNSYPMLNKLFVYSNINDNNIKLLKDIYILKGVNYEISNISFSYDDGVWNDANYNIIDDNVEVNFGNIYSNVTATITISNNGFTDSINELRFSNSNLEANFEVNYTNCENKKLAKNETCSITLLYKYSSSIPGTIDNLNIYISDEGEAIEDSIIAIDISGHRKKDSDIELVSIDNDENLTEINFGALEYLEEKEISVVLNNTGEILINSCTFESSIEKESFFISLNPSLPVSYNQEFTFNYKFVFNINELANQNHSLNVSCDLENNTSISFSLPVIANRLNNAELFETNNLSEHDFGLVSSVSACKEFIISNDGESIAGNLNLSLTNATSFEFDLASQDDCSGFSSLAGSNTQTCRVNVCFTNMDEGTYEDSLIISSTPGNELSIGLSAIRATLFISVWDTRLTSSGSSNTSQVKLPLYEGGTYDFYVDWGDNTNNIITSYNQAEVTHTYASSGIYTIKIAGTLNGFRFNNSGDRRKILDIQKWGDLELGNLGSYFRYCTSLTNISADDAPNLENMTNFESFFHGASALITVNNINNWDTSSATSMKSMFTSASNFNSNIGSWHVGNVTKMDYMFKSATSFNQDIGSWDVSNLVNITEMFRDASSFSQNLNLWNVSKIELSNYAFAGATSFNGDISNWNTSKFYHMSYMFQNATSFNQNISSWNVSNARSMQHVFDGASNFDQCLGSWNVEKAQNLSNFLRNVTLSKSNYDCLLVGWSSKNLPLNLNFHGGNSKYSEAGQLAKQSIIDNFNWSFQDGGLDN